MTDQEIKHWMASLTREQLQRAVTELLSIGIQAEMVRTRDGIPVHYHTGDPIILTPKAEL